jgi:signal transduction histidine kinase
MVQTGHDLVTDRDLLDLQIYGSVAERALRNRLLRKDLDSALENANDLLRATERDSGSLIFASSVVSSFAHDLLTSCDSMLENFQDLYSHLRPSQIEDTKGTRQAIGREIAFVRNCMERAVDVARMNQITGKNFQYANIHDLIGDAEASFSRLFDKYKVTFVPVLLAKDPMLLCEPLLIKQVLSNLIANACTSLYLTSHRVRTLKVHTARDREAFTIVVEDNGLGIDPAIEDLIWKPFFSTKEKGVGTGLGLMICERIVDKIHGGIITAHSKHGYGAKFVVKLPIVERAR